MIKRILIVDDNAINRKYANTVLKSAANEIHEAEDGESALQLVGNNKYDLILMDIQMPGMDGFECLHQIRVNFPDHQCPILAVTAFSGKEEADSFHKAGFSALITKPIKPQELKKAVAEWLSGSNPELEKSNNKKSSTQDIIVDLSVYEGLQKYASKEDIMDIYMEFEKETSGFIDQLKFLVPAKNYPEILSILHTIKGNAGSLGIATLADKTRQVEANLRDSEYRHLERDFDHMQALFNDFIENYRILLT